MFPYNDKWMIRNKEEYCTLVDKSDDKLELLANKDDSELDSESKPDMVKEVKAAEELKVKALLQNQIKSEMKSISDSIAHTSTTVTGMESNSIGVAQGQALRGSLNDISNRIEIRLQKLSEQITILLDETEAEKFQTEQTDFISMQRARVDSIEMAIVLKTKEAPVSTSAGHSRQSGSSHTYLKKQDPPRFSGDILEFPEFKRRWAAQVTIEKLEEETELDRLRDNIPDTAKKMLTGEKSLKKAWEILTQLFGNKTLLANKLKAKLKNLKCSGKEDHEVVINLAIEVKVIVKSLTELKMQDMLKYDDEYLSAIFRALPSQDKTKWLNFDMSKYTTEWEAMEAFLEEAHEKATKTKILLSSYAAIDAASDGIRCRRCQEIGHKKQDCTKTFTVKVAAAKAKDSDESDSEDFIAKKQQDRKKFLEDQFGKCPLCKKKHTFTRTHDGQIWPSDRFSVCESFRKLSEKARAEVLEKNKACARCTSWRHDKDSNDCKAPKKSCNCDKGGGNKCKGDHSRMVCGSGNVYCASVQTSCKADAEDPNSPNLAALTSMLIEDVKIKTGSKTTESRVMWDDGSNRVLINNQFAKDQDLRSQRVKYKLLVPGGKETIEDGVVYELELVDNSGQTHKIWGFGIDTIIDPPDPIDLQPVRDLFPHIPQHVFEPLPQKRLDILIGLNFFSLHPDGGQGRNNVENLKALHSKFSKGWLIAGTHPLLKMPSPRISTSALAMARICRVEIRPEVSFKSPLNFKPQYCADFWEAENLGVLPPKRCGRCMQCTECKDTALIRSRREQDELELLKQSIKLKDGELLVSYPFVKSPECFPNNRGAVVAMAKKQETRLLKKGDLDKYNLELRKYITRGVIVPLSEKEINEYKGPVNYISHHGVENPSSVTTPYRIVTNSSLKNGIRSLNECLPKGPNSLNSMFDISVRFRCYETGMVFDLTKAYNSMKTGLVEKHLRRLVWRFSSEEPWQDFGFVVVAFGDKPAGEFLELGRNLAADAGSHIDPVASRKSKQDSYVDDGVTGGSKAEVEKMKGTRLEDGKYTGTMTHIMKKANLNIKVIVSSGETDSSAKDLLGNKVLGYTWEATSDQMSLQLPINISGRIRKTKPKPDLTSETLHLLQTTKLTKRLCLSMTNAFGDFMGIACPFVLRFKLLMKQIFDDKEITAWNDEIKEDSKKAWVELLTETVFTGSICFPRCTRPENAVGGPHIVTFSDGSFSAFSAAVYLRYEVTCIHGDDQECNGDYSAQLLCAKAKVTPLTGLTVPRSELSGLLLSSRLSLTVAKALSKEDSLHPVGAILLSDSECSISALDKSSSALKPYFHNRVSEIRENLAAIKEICDVEEVFHVPGDLNVADIATRPGVKLKDLGPDSLWQRGPAFLSCRRDLWPVNRTFVKTEVPEEELRTKKTNLFAAAKISLLSEVSTWDAIFRVMQYSNSFKKVISILSRVIRGWKLDKVMEVVRKEPVASELQLAERLVVLSAMPASYIALESGKLDSLMPQKEGLVLVTTGRIGEESLSRLLGVASLPILMPNTRAAYLYMMRAHCGDDNLVHKSAVETLARSRSSVLIVRGKSLAKSICKNCPMCIKRKKEMCSQQIAKIKPQNLEICRPWTYISLDFAGPIICKGVVNARARRKCWVLVYVCRNTKAVCLLATFGYDTASFLLRHEEFVARKGAPKEIVSDQGSQLVAAGEIIANKKETPDSWDWDRVQKENNTTTWEFVPVGSQHHNGLPEAMVKALKRTLAQALNPGVILSYAELVTLLARITCVINSRPLGLSNISNSDQQEDILLPLTPNHMLLGRSSPESPVLDYSESDKFCQRLSYVAAVEKEWWERWIKTILPTMLPARKWKKKQANLVVGDVVLLIYSGKIKDDYVLARVTEVHPDGKNLVRRVTVKYRRRNTREPSDVCKSKMEEKIVAVQRLVLLVPAPRSDSSGSTPPPSTTSSTSVPTSSTSVLASTSITSESSTTPSPSTPIVAASAASAPASTPLSSLCPSPTALSPQSSSSPE